MSNEKPTATAVIRFFPTGRKVTVELDTIVGVSPRNLSIANNLLMREYRGMRGAHNAQRHREARAAKKAEDEKSVTDTAAFHKKEDNRLDKLAKKAKGSNIKLLEKMLKIAKGKITAKE